MHRRSQAKTDADMVLVGMDVDGARGPTASKSIGSRLRRPLESRDFWANLPHDLRRCSEAMNYSGLMVISSGLFDVLLNQDEKLSVQNPCWLMKK